MRNAETHFTPTDSFVHFPLRMDTLFHTNIKRFRDREGSDLPGTPPGTHMPPQSERSAVPAATGSLLLLAT